MAEQNITIDYKKFNSFIKDYMKMMKRGWLFLIISEGYNIGDKLTFGIKVAGLDKELGAEGVVVYSGQNKKGSEGIGMRFSFNNVSKEYLSDRLDTLIRQKYGETWGSKICSIIGEE